MKVKEFWYLSSDNENIDDQINEFVEKNNVRIIDIKYSSYYDSGNEIDCSTALLLYTDGRNYDPNVTRLEKSLEERIDPKNVQPRQD